MSSNGASQPFSQEDFGRWREQRQDMEPYLREIYPQVKILLEDAEEIVDLCGGEGYTHDVLPDEFSPRLTTVDLDKNALRRLKVRHPEAKIVRADANKTPFADESFDAAIAINGIGGSDAFRSIKEAERILRPGGVLVFMHDLPRNPRRTVADMLSKLQPPVREGTYILPLLNYPSGNADIFAYVSKLDVEVLPVEAGVSAAVAMDKTAPLLGEDWIEKVYGDTLMIGAYAKLFKLLVKELQAAYGEDRVVLTDPMVPDTKKTVRKLIKKANLEGEVVDLEVDYETDEPHSIRGQEVSSLFVDEFALPRVVYKSRTSRRAGTKVSGKTPVYIGRKP